jgi:hypothetical protein
MFSLNIEILEFGLIMQSTTNLYLPLLMTYRSKKQADVLVTAAKNLIFTRIKNKERILHEITRDLYEYDLHPSQAICLRQLPY